MERDRVKYILAVSGKTYLDKTYGPVLERLKARYVFGATSFPAPPGKYISVLGDYIIDVRLSPTVAQQVRELYMNTKSAADFSPQAALAFAATRGGCSLELSANPERAKRERRKFEVYFDS